MEMFSESTCLRVGPYELFEHRVDQSIQRDVLVAVKN